MKITAESDYFDHECPFYSGCYRAYCPRHRLLYRACSTAERGFQGDSGGSMGGKAVYDLEGDCPRCKSEYEAKREMKLRDTWERLKRA